MNNSTRYAVGLDTSDREVHIVVREPGGAVLHETSLPLDRHILELYFRDLRDLNPVIALETGTHANWLYDLFRVLGFADVIVADARKLKMISQSDKKSDHRDALTLAKFAQSCPELLHPVQPRCEQARQDRRLLSARHVTIEARTKLIAHVRGVVKSTGERLPTCDSDKFPRLAASLPETLRQILTPVMEVVRQMNDTIGQLDELIEQRCKGDPIIETLTQVPHVGPVTGLAYSATIESPTRFHRNRAIASFLGIRPKLDQSGEIDKQLPITKAGDSYLRQLLVISAQGILRRSSPDCDLKRWGLAIATRGGKRGKRRAAVAVARKLAVLLLSLWKSGAEYEPLRNAPPKSTTRRRRASTTADAASPISTTSRRRKAA